MARSNFHQLWDAAVVLLVNSNFEHNVAHYLYRRILSLRGLLYRLLVALMVSIIVVAIGVTASSTQISDTFNAPLAAVLIVWTIYVLIHLGLEIKRVSRLEDEFHRQETEMKISPGT